MSRFNTFKDLIVASLKDAIKISITAIPVLLFIALLFINFQLYQRTNLVNTGYIIFASKFLSELLLVMGIYSLLFFAKLANNKLAKTVGGIALAIYFIADTTLIYYYNYSGLYLNAFALKMEFRDIPKIIYISLTSIDNFWIIALGAIIVLVLLIVGVNKIFDILNIIFQHDSKSEQPLFHIKSQKNAAWLMLSLLALGIIFNATDKIPNQVVYFTKQYLSNESDTNTAKIYQEGYFNSIKTNESNSGINPATGRKIIGGDNFFIVQLESLNSKAVNKTITPNLTGIAQTNGIFFPNIQGSTVDTILSEEVTLCSALPTLYGSLSQSPSLTGNMACLPKILKKYGYKTLFFGNYPDLGFANYGDFMREIGFDEVHSADIMTEEDNSKYSLPWGYREDVFFQRVFDYIEKYKNEKMFVYIAVSATNHFPFYQKNSFKYFKQEVPFPDPSDSYEKMADTTFIQDYYFGQLYNGMFYKKYGENSDLMVFGDHSFPFKNSVFSFSGFRQENFATSAAIIPSSGSKEKLQIGKTLTQFYGQNDYLPTILDLLNIDIAGYAFMGKSIYSDFSRDDKNSSGDKSQNRCLISVQPFSEGFISALEFPEKYVFSIRNNTVIKFNLKTDPDEKTPIYEKMNSDYAGILKNCMAADKKTGLPDSNIGVSKNADQRAKTAHSPKNF